MSSKMSDENQFVIENKVVTVYPSATANRPVVYLNTVAEEGGSIYQELRDGGCPDFTLVAVSKLNWDHDMAPWDIPPMIDTIYSYFENVVANHRNEPAVIENHRTMTFGELSNLVDIIACSFPKKITSIGIVMSHRAEMIASILSVLKCGARYIPAEPDFPAGRIHDMMKEAEVDFILKYPKTIADPRVRPKSFICFPGLLDKGRFKKLPVLFDESFIYSRILNGGRFE